MNKQSSTKSEIARGIALNGPHLMFVTLCLTACGVREPLMLPNPPPAPVDLQKGAEENEVTVSGRVSAMSADTRSWVQVGDGQTVIGHLPATGVLNVDGRAALAGDLIVGMEITTHGHQDGDLVIVLDAKATTPAALLPPSASAAEGATAAASTGSEAAAAEPAEPPKAAAIPAPVPAPPATP